MDAATLTGSSTQETPENAAAPHDADAAPAGLSERDQQVLAFERQWWKYAGAKEQAIRELFDMSATRYYQVLNSLIDSPAALAHDPMLIKRLRRMRSTRQRARTARRLGGDA
ncbi:DUF3263 domain-containing protein [Cellulomonas sp. NPDC055163]